MSNISKYTLYRVTKALLAISLIIFLHFKSFSQTGPGGLGGPTLRTWVRADRGVSITSGEALQWNDQSGNGLNFTGTAGTAPSLVSSVATINNRPVIRFNAGGNRELRGPSAATLFGEDTDPSFAGDVFVVFLQPTGNNGHVIQFIRQNTLGSTASFLSLMARRRGDGAPGSTDENDINTFASISPGTWVTASSQGGVLNNNFTNDQYHVARFGFNANNLWVYNIETLAQNSGGVNIRYNQGVETGNLGQSPLRLGRSTQYTGDIAELFIFDTQINPTQYRILQNYFNAQYGFAITNDHYSGAAGYNNDLIGIGKLGVNSKVDSTFGSSGGLLLAEANTSIVDDEWVFAAHNNSTTSLVIADAPVGESRVNRIWRIEKTGTLDTKVIFNLAELGLPTTSASDFKLLSRSGTSGDFSNVTTSSANIVGNTIVFEIENTELTSGNYYTLGVQSIPSTWYVFQNGNWDNAANWTTDASFNPIQVPFGGGIPNAFDNVFIRSGRSISITSNDKSLQSIRVDGTLNLGTTSGHNFGVINGKGTIRSSGSNSNFPQGDASGGIGFGDRINGGTFEIFGSGNTIINQNLSLRNIIVNKDNSSDIVRLAENVDLSGDLDIIRGDFRFGDNTTARSLIVNENLNIRPNGFISVHTADARHRLELKGDFINQGITRFTNRTDFANDTDRFNTSNTYYTSQATNGIVDVLLTANDRNQLIDLQNSTFFYRVVIQKGLDPTYEAIFTSAQESYFALLGWANGMSDSDITNEDQNLNAFSLVSGTARIGNNVRIPVLSNSGNYTISSAARLLLDGGYLRKVNGAAIVPYGTLQVDAGELVADMQSGVTLRGSGSLIINGGTATLRAFRTSIQGISAQGTFEQNGGNVLVTGSAGINADYSLFALNYSGNVFKMGGGTLTIRNAPSLGTGGERGAVFINCDPQNIAVTGGTVIFESNRNTHEYRITSKAPFYNVIMRSAIADSMAIVLRQTTSGTGAAPATVILPAQPLRVLNDLIIEGYNDTNARANNPLGSFPITFAPVTSLTNVNDVYVGGSMYVGRNSTYLPLFGGTFNYDGIGNFPDTVNITYFNQTLATSPIDTLYWGVTGGGFNMLEMGSFVLERTTGNQLRTIARTGNNGAIRFDINGNMSVLSGTLDQNAYTFRIWGATTNNDRLGTYFASGTYPTASGTPSLAQVRFREDPPFIFEVGPNAIFGNIRLNVGAASTIEINNDLYFERVEYLNGRIYAKNHTVTIDEIWNWNNGGGGNFFNNNTVADSSFLRVNNTGILGNIAIITNGKASDGGLRLRINGNTVAEDSISRVNNRGPITFPVGFTFDNMATVYMRPFQAKIRDFADDGYIRVRVVSGELQTTALTGGELLRHYWRVNHDGFSTLPTVAYRGYFRVRTDGNNVDLQTGYANLNNYVPGKVLDGGTYARSFESSPTLDTSDIDTLFQGTNNQTRFITFNGTSNNAEFDQNDFSGFTLENANYTAGVSTRFVGAPTIYYSRMTNNQDWYDRDWEDGTSWSLTPHDGANNNSARAAAGTWPQAGDIAVIGYGGFTGGISPTHSINIENSASIEVADIRFFNPNGNANRLVIDRTASLVFGKIGGTGGTFMERPRVGEMPTISGDFGEFYQSNTFTYAYYLDNDGTFNITPPTSVFPNLRVEGGNSNRIAIFQSDIVVNNNMTVDGNTVVRTNNGINGDIKIIGDLRIGGFLGGNFQFNSGFARTVEVGRLWLRNQGNCNISVLNTSPNTLRHRFILNGDILQQRPGIIDFYNGTGATANHAILELKGNGMHSYTKTDGSTADFYQIIMNKGTEISNTFIFSEPFNLPNANSTFQPLEILNGLLILDDQVNGGSGILLAESTNFPIPNLSNPIASSGSGGLELRGTKARIEGDNTGILLDGLLRISGDTLDMSTGIGNGNNFIEYSPTGNSVIEVTSGLLNVGSQIRRSLTSTAGVLKYRQTGGNVLLAQRSTPNTTRGVFEVLNAGSEFVLTGGNFVVRRGTNSINVPSVTITPETSNVTAPIYLGSTGASGFGIATPSGQNNFGLMTNVALKKLVVNGSNSPIVKLYSLPLLTDSIDISTSNTFDPQEFNVSINRHLQNNGTYLQGSIDQTTIFPSDVNATIAGSGTTTFHNFRKSGSGELILSKNVTTANLTEILEGTLNTNLSGFYALNNVVHDAIHISDPTGEGFVFNGVAEQILSNSNAGAATATFGVLEINNPADVIIPDIGDRYIISDRLILNTGIFDIGGTLITVLEDATIVNGLGAGTSADFSTTNMIHTNSAPDDNGVRKRFPSGFSGSIVFPVGKRNDPDAGNLYTPGTINITSSTVTSPAYITVKPITGVTAGLAEDNDETCLFPGASPEYDIPDDQNVLQYHWLLKSANITNMNASFTFQYDQSDFALSSHVIDSGFSSSNYAPARLLDASNNWDLGFSNELIDLPSRTITFAANDSGDPFIGLNSAVIAGSYTAGFTVTSDGNPLCGGAIPPTVPIFETFPTATSGNYNNAASYIDAEAPSPSISPDLLVKGNFNLNLNVNNVRFRKVTIEPNATLTVNGTIGHRLGILTGTGTLNLAPSVDDGLVFPNFEPEEAFPADDCTGGGIQFRFSGDVDYNIPVFSTVRSITFAGSGDRRLNANESMLVCQNLTIGNTVNLEFNNSGAFTFNVKGNVTLAAGGTITDANNNANIWMTSSTNQLLSGNFSGANALAELRINKSNGDVSILGNTHIKEYLRLVDGNIEVTGSNTLKMLNGATYGPSNNEFGVNSYVSGPLVRDLSETVASSAFPFAVGASGRYGRLDVVGPRGYAPAGNKDWRVTYTADGFAFDELTPAAVAAGIQKASENEHWSVNVPSAAQADLRLTWNSTSNVSSTISNLRVVRWNGTAWDFVPHISGGAPSGSPAAGNHTAGLFSFSEVLVTNATIDEAVTPLPVELVSFSAREESGMAILNWVTASEKDNDFFEIHRSQDGFDWQQIGTVKGKGTTNETQNYNFNDLQPHIGTNYYKLRQVDFDGKYEYSDVVFVNIRFGDFSSSIVPNPVVDEMIFQVSGIASNEEVKYKIITISGIVVLDGTIIADQNGRCDTKIQKIETLRPGIYLLIAETSNQPLRHRFIKK